LKNEIILLVEDNPDVEALAVRALTFGNFVNEVVVARDGVEVQNYLLVKALRRAVT
jgi:hypothetical protein